MGVDLVFGALVGTHAMLGFWISNLLAARQGSFRMAVWNLIGFIVGVIVGSVLGYLVLTVLLQLPIPAGRWLGILSMLVFVVPLVLITRYTESRLERKSRDLRAVISFLALLLTAALGMAVNYLLFVALPGHEIPTTFSFAFWLGVSVGSLYTFILSRVIGALLLRPVPPATEQPAGGIILLP